MLAIAASSTSNHVLHSSWRIAFRHQLGVLRRSLKRPKRTPVDRCLWAWLSQVWIDWRSSVVIVKPEIVIAWHRKSFRLFWTWKAQHGLRGWPSMADHTYSRWSRRHRCPVSAIRRGCEELPKAGSRDSFFGSAYGFPSTRRTARQTGRTFLESHAAERERSRINEGRPCDV